MLRHNLQQFEEKHLRPITIQSAQAFKRVIREISWQLCAWLERYQCRHTLKNFLRHILRFEDVIPNYVMACFAFLDMDEELYKTASTWNWALTLTEGDVKLRKYLNEGESGLPKKYRAVDFFAADKGFNAIKAAAEPLHDDETVVRDPPKHTDLPSDVKLGIY